MKMYPRYGNKLTKPQSKICLKSPCTSISASSAVLAVQGLLRHILEPLSFFQKMSPLVALTIILVAVSAAPSQTNKQASKNSVSQVGLINLIDFLIVCYCGGQSAPVLGFVTLGLCESGCTFAFSSLL